MDIKKVVVIGSGTMGSGIAAHLCNANVPVTLLDLTTEISEKARDRIFKSKPPLLLDKSQIENIKVGNINDNFDVVKEADWVVEAVVERIDIKHDIYEKIFKDRKEDIDNVEVSYKTVLADWDNHWAIIDQSINKRDSCTQLLTFNLKAHGHILRHEHVRGESHCCSVGTHCPSRIPGTGNRQFFGPQLVRSTHSQG